MPLDDMNKQTSLTRSEPFTDEEIAVAKVLQMGPRQTATRFREYAGDLDMKESGGGLFGSRSQAESFDLHFGEEKGKMPPPITEQPTQARLGPGAANIGH